MSVYYKSGVLFLLFLHLRCCMLIANESEEIIFSAEDYDEEYNDDEDDGVFRSIPEEVLNVGYTTPVIPNLNTIANDGIASAIPKLLPHCPDNCECGDYYEIVNCSNRGLDKFPSNLPEKVKVMDLRYNAISNLEEVDFSKYSRIKEIYLSGNKINNIGKELFKNIRKLERIDLGNNKLTTIDPNTFSEAVALVTINLNNNPIRLPENTSFLNQPGLKNLYLHNCTLSKLYDDTFKNLSLLNKLDLSENNLNMTINLKAFEPLKNLANLRLPNIDKESFKRLCEILPSIDVINSKEYNISCYELISEVKFDQNITDGNGANSAPKFPTTSTKQEPNKKGKPKVLTIAEPTSQELSEGIAKNKKPSNETEKGETNKETYQVAVSSETINHVLIGIIIIAVAGLIVGMVCRKDICGIKTKLCRTRQPISTDQVRPAEEVPLNKV